MNDALVFALLFCAVAGGWWLGRRSERQLAASPAGLPSQYYRGLNYLLDGRPDGAVDHFISALEVNSETLETHIALGNVLRRRGEVDRAIRIHENLLARPNLPRSQMHIAHLELARDYISAGLLDRAETLLLALVEESDAQIDVSRQYLLEIYRSESEWQRAIDQASLLLPRKGLLRSAAQAPQLSGQPIPVQLAHFYCELAIEMMAEARDDEARALLQKALRSDPNCARASLELGHLEAEAGNDRLAIEALTRVVEQHAEFLPLAIPALRKCHAALGEEAALSTYLSRALDQHPSTPLMLEVADDIYRDAGSAAAHRFLAERLAEAPSLRGLLRLIRIQQKEQQKEQRKAQEETQQEQSGLKPTRSDDALTVLSMLLERLIQERPAYRCDHCGFSARHLLWFCPGCKYWGTSRTIRTAETE